ncbi:hypothetical protein HAX54_028776 [Datura stramonium]|uniref:Uncharacterized protein n=1 Tax=Datura stramonium TaxID=4076 RepID=A0ABS8S9S8_DATST|nr:hypothetical protein [Datura stramonium]
MAEKVDDNIRVDEEISQMEQGIDICTSQSNTISSIGFCSSPSVVTVAQKLIAEAIGTYFIIFAGCGSVAVNKLYDESITFPGICVTWGLIVMVMIYSVGHVSGGHFNPAVTITFTIFGRFSWKLAPLYIIAQANFRSIDEPSKEHWSSYCEASLQRSLGLYSWATHRNSSRSICIQLD